MNLKYAPEISFYFDETINEVERLDELFSSEKVKNDTISSKIKSENNFFLVVGYLSINQKM